MDEESDESSEPDLTAPGWLAAAGGAAAIVGALLPWSTVSVGFRTVTTTGVSDAGVFILIFAFPLAVVGGRAAMSDYQPPWKMSVAAMLLAVGIFGVGFVNLVDLSRKLDQVQVGSGLWLTAAAGVVSFVGSWQLHQRSGS